jgi:hypothetical protein
MPYFQKTFGQNMQRKPSDKFGVRQCYLFFEPVLPVILVVKSHVLMVNTIIDKGTFENGPAFSEGIEYVIVNGVFMLKNGKTVGNVFAGQPIYGKYKR